MPETWHQGSPGLRQQECDDHPEQHRPYPYFDAIIDGTHTSAAKPDPEVFLLGAEAVNTAPQHCVVFEDAEAGILAATRAGMRSVGIGSPETLGAANLVVPSLQQISVRTLQESFASV